MLAYVSHDPTPGFERDVAHDVIDFYNAKTYLRREDSWVQIEVPTDVGVSLHRNWVLFSPQTAWTRHGKTHVPGSLLLADLEEFMAGTASLREIFVPTDSTSLQSIDFTANYLLLNVLQDVSSQILVCDPSLDFALSPLEAGAPLHSFSISAVDDLDPECADDYWLTITGFLTPTTLARGTIGSASAPASPPRVVKAAPARFDASEFEVSQHFAVSDDGTRVPYFQVSPADLPLDGLNPVLMNGYGGFQASLTPGYVGTLGPGWLTRSTAERAPRQLRRGEHPRRRGIRSALAPCRTSRKPPSRLRGLRRRRPRPGGPRSDLAQAPCRDRAFERRTAHGQHDHRLPRTLRSRFLRRPAA